MGRLVQFRRSRQPAPPWVKHRRQRSIWPKIAAAAAAAVLGGLAVHFVTEGTVSALVGKPRLAAMATSAGPSFTLCQSSHANDCVIDGDTISFHGQRIRMIDYDAPEISEPHCASEAALGHRAKLRLLELLNSGVVDIRTQGSRDEDRYGRKLRLVLVDGRSVGDTLIAEGLAWPWQGRRHAWC